MLYLKKKQNNSYRVAYYTSRSILSFYIFILLINPKSPFLPTSNIFAYYLKENAQRKSNELLISSQQPSHLFYTLKNIYMHVDFYLYNAIRFSDTKKYSIFTFILKNLYKNNINIIFFFLIYVLNILESTVFVHNDDVLLIQCIFSV